MKKQATDWETIFAKHKSDRGLVAKVDKELFKLNDKKTNSVMYKWAKDMNRCFTKEDT